MIIDLLVDVTLRDLLSFTRILMIVIVDDGFIVMVVQHPLFIYTENNPDWLPSLEKY